MALLTGQAARDWIAKNPERAFNKLDKTGKVLERSGQDTVKMSTLGKLIPILRPIQATADLTSNRISNDKDNFRSKFVDQDTFEQYKKNPLLKFGQDAASIASVALPFAGLKGAIAAGGLAGAGEGNGGDEIVGNILKGGALGGTVGLAAKAAGGLFNMGANRAAKAGEGGFLQNLGATMKRGGRNIEKKNIGINYTKQLKNPAALQDELYNITKKYGGKADTVGQETALNTIYGTRDSLIEDFVRKNPKLAVTEKKIFSDDFNNRLTDIATNYGKSVDEVRAIVQRKLGQGRFGELDGIANKKFNVGDVDGLLKTINKESYNKSGTILHDVNNALKDNLKNSLSEYIPQYKGLTREAALLEQNIGATGKLEAKGAPSASENFAKTISPIDIEKTKYSLRGAVGRGLQKTGDKLAGAGSGQPGKVAEQINKFQSYLEKSGLSKTQATTLAARNAFLAFEDSDGNGVVDFEEGKTDPKEMKDAAPGVNQNDVNAQRRELVDELMQQTDNKGKRVYKNYSEALKEADVILSLNGINTGNTKEGKPKSASDKKLTSFAKGGIRSIDTIEKILGSDSSARYKTKLPGLLKGSNARQLETAIDNVADAIGRIRSGGAINEAEEERFKKQLPNLGTDDAETIKAKLEEVRMELEDVL